jgi:hypothetical protein
MAFTPPSLGATAWLKVLLHAARHPASDVTGVLLARAGDRDCDIVDAVPVSHHALMPALADAASMLVRRCSPPPLLLLMSPWRAMR